MMPVICLYYSDTLLSSMIFTMKLNETPTSTILRTNTSHGQLPFLIVHRRYVNSHLDEQPNPNTHAIFVGQFVTRWIDEELPRSSNAKCLILIGPTNTGRTLFMRVWFLFD